MPPKKAKKGKDRGDDDLWAGKEISIPGLEALQDDFKPAKKSTSSFAAIASLNDDEADPFAGEEMGGGLLGAIQANINKKTKKKDKDKKGTKALDSPDLNSPGSELPAQTPNNEPAAQKTVDELPEDEWALPDKKAKGKKGQSKDQGASTPTHDEIDADVAGDADENGGSSRPLSKKEKEKLKKDRDKAKKKAQAQAKKAETGLMDESVPESPREPASDLSAPPPPDPAGADEDDEEEGDGGPGAKSDKKKKKKKKPAAQEKEPPKKKVTPAIAALLARREQIRAAEEEAERKAEEERLRIEEEERQAAEEERLKEEAKQKRKEKEKAKKDLARKEGRLLTDKQKKERAQAEVAKQALIASGVRIEGLERGSVGATATKRVVYGNKKKKPTQPGIAGSVGGPSEPSTPDIRTSQSLPDPAEAPSTTATPSTPTVDIPEDVKDEWDASTDEEDAPSPALASNGPGSCQVLPEERHPLQLLLGHDRGSPWKYSDAIKEFGDRVGVPDWDERTFRGTEYPT